MSAPNGGRKKKEAITKRSKVGGPSIGALSIAIRASIPCITFIPLRISMQSDEEVEIMVAPIAVAQVVPSTVPTLDMLTSMP